MPLITVPVYYTEGRKCGVFRYTWSAHPYDGYASSDQLEVNEVRPWDDDDDDDDDQEEEEEAGCRHPHIMVFIIPIVTAPCS
jgi:hypothetical protein